jgi:uncharacterized membrane protein
MIILGIIFLRRQKGNTYSHLFGCIGRIWVLILSRVMISFHASYILVVISCQNGILNVVYTPFISIFQLSEHYIHGNLQLLRKKLEDTKRQTMQWPKMYNNSNNDIHTFTQKTADWVTRTHITIEGNSRSPKG